MMEPTKTVPIRNFIDGEFVEPVSGNYLDNIEPATGKPYSQVADSDSRDVELAVTAAEKAFAAWSKTSAATSPSPPISSGPAMRSSARAASASTASRSRPPRSPR